VYIDQPTETQMKRSGRVRRWMKRVRQRFKSSFYGSDADFNYEQRLLNTAHSSRLEEGTTRMKLKL
jgi:hypothetical protein